VADFSVNPFIHNIHPISMFTVHLNRVDADFHLADGRVQLVDHAADFVEAFDWSAKMQAAGADDRDAALGDWVNGCELSGGEAVAVSQPRCDFPSELFLTGTQLCRFRLGHLPAFADFSFLFPHELGWKVCCLYGGIEICFTSCEVGFNLSQALQ
jgi:hypothetical protein